MSDIPAFAADVAFHPDTGNRDHTDADRRLFLSNGTSGPSARSIDTQTCLETSCDNPSVADGCRIIDPGIMLRRVSFNCQAGNLTVPAASLYRVRHDEATPEEPARRCPGEVGRLQGRQVVRCAADAGRAARASEEGGVGALETRKARTKRIALRQTHRTKPGEARKTSENSVRSPRRSGP
jgi:hypothetical protein